MSTQALIPNLTSRAKGIVTALNLHLAGVVVLLAVNIYFAVHLFLAWNGVRQASGDAVSQQQSAMKTAEVQAKPLRGLDVKLDDSRTQADKFTETRLPYLGSSIYAELGALAKKNGVKLTRAQYTPTASADAPDPNLTEVRMDATLSGDYRPLVQFVNALERDKMFFLITSMTLTGQAGGGANNIAAGSIVNLRLRLTTYIRQPLPADAKEKSPEVKP